MKITVADLQALGREPTGSDCYIIAATGLDITEAHLCSKIG